MTNLLIVLINAFFSYLITYIIINSFDYENIVVNIFQILLFVVIFIWNLNMIKHPSIKIFTGIYFRVKEKALQIQN